VSEYLSDHRRVINTGGQINGTAAFGAKTSFLEGLLLAYCVEKLVSCGIRVNRRKLPGSNLLFLLNRVSAGTSEIRRRGVFQHNRPGAAIESIVFQAN
jgi:hypothetical protein